MHENIIHLRQRISRSGIFIYREEILRPVRVRCVSLRRQSLDPSPHGILSPFSHLLRHIYCFHRCAGFRSTGRHLQKLCQCDDSYQNSCTKQSHPDISADSCPSAATLSLRPRQALSCARVVGIVSAYVSIRYSQLQFSVSVGGFCFPAGALHYDVVVLCAFLYVCPYFSRFDNPPDTDFSASALYGSLPVCPNDFPASYCQSLRMNYFLRVSI